MDKIKAAKNLLGICEKSLRDNEYNIRKVKGVSCSHSDVETVILYAETFLNTGGFSGLMQPRGEVRAVLQKAGLVA